MNLRESQQSFQSVRPNHALQRTRRGCNPRVPCAGSLSLGRSAAKIFRPSRVESETTN
jgi:hypothetical protein